MILPLKLYLSLFFPDFYLPPNFHVNVDRLKLITKFTIIMHSNVKIGVLGKTEWMPITMMLKFLLFYVTTSFFKCFNTETDGNSLNCNELVVAFTK